MDPTVLELQQIVSLQKLCEWVGIGDSATRKTATVVLGALGGPKLLRQLVAIPYEAYERTLNGIKVVEKIGEEEVETDLTPLELGQVGELRRVARLALGLGPEVTSRGPIPSVHGLLAPPGGAPASSGAPGTAGNATDVAHLAQAIRDAIKPPSKKICASRVIDQADDTEVVPLDPKVLSTLVEDWRQIENDGEEPTEEEEATSDQIASLDSRARSGATPFVDFGVWRPYGSRMERAMKFVVHQQQGDGTSKPKEINGPDTYAQRIKCWRVYAFAMVTLKLATRTRLQRYADRIRLLSEEWSQFWWVIGLADIKMRSEALERVRRECGRRKKAGQLPDFDETKPWDVAYREAAADTDFWGREVDKQIVMFTTSLRSASRIRDIGTGPIIELRTSGTKGRRGHAASDSSDDSSGSQANRRKKGSAAKAKKKKRGPPKKAKAANSQGQAQGPKGGGKDKTPGLLVDPSRAQEKKRDGAWTRDESGRQICYAYGRGACKRQCPTGRAHCCEKCRGTDHCLKDCKQAA